MTGLRPHARTLGLAGLAVALASFDGSVLFLALPAIGSEFRAALPSLSNLVSALTLGALGALPLAVVADRAGRRRLLAGGVLGFSIANLASAFAASLLQLALLRLVAVAFEGAVVAAATALVVEAVGPEQRSLAVGAMTLAGGIGSGVTVVTFPLVAPHWRLLYAAGAAGVAAAPLLWRTLPESSRWQLARHDTFGVRLLLDYRWRGRLLVAAASALLGGVLYEPANLFTVFFGSRYLGFSPVLLSVLVAASGAFAAAGYLGGGWLSDRTGRRTIGTMLSLLAAIFAAGAFAVGVGGFWAGNLGASLLAGASTPVVAAWLAELFPTRARVTAESAAGIAGAAGGVAGLQVVGLLTPNLGFGRVFTGLGIAGAAGALLLLLLPETRGAKLAD